MQIKSVYIPDSVTYIGEYAFINNQLSFVAIPNPNCDINYYAFDKNVNISLAEKV